MKVEVKAGRIHVGERFSVSVQRTLRIPDDGREYPLPPGLGPFPVFRVEDFAAGVPPHWRERGGFFIPLYQREALWLGFRGAEWKPNALKVGVGEVNAISGEAWDERLRADPQDYLVCPTQPWLDGINAGGGSVRQFVAMPLGAGYTVEAQLREGAEAGGLRLAVYEPRPGLFPDTPPEPEDFDPMPMSAPAGAGSAELGLAAGGRMRQKIYPDPYGVETWDEDAREAVLIRILNSEQFRQVTGLEPAPSPVDAATYTEYGLPWFDLYDEALGDVPAPERLARVRSVKELDEERGAPHAEERPLSGVPEDQIKKLRHGRDKVKPRRR